LRVSMITPVISKTQRAPKKTDLKACSLRSAGFYSILIFALPQSPNTSVRRQDL
jgi:hypothetical protein